MLIRGETLCPSEESTRMNSTRPSKFFCIKQAGFVVISMATQFAEVSEEVVTILVNEGVPQETMEDKSYTFKAFEGKET